MIDFISTDDLRRMADATDRFCVSIYLPTHASGSEMTQNPIRFKNLLSGAAAELEALSLTRRQIEGLLAPAEEVRNDHGFWTTMGSGLAVFVDPNGMRTYRVPTVLDELVVVAERFHLKPLLSSVSADEVFYVLALSQAEVRLLRGNRFSMSNVSLGDIPASLAEVVKYDDREAQLQSHGGSRIGGGRVAAVFHGQGGGKDTKKNDLDRFLAAVDRGFRDIVGNSKAPLVLAGVDHVVAHYRKLSSYGHITAGDVSGNPERLGPDELHRRAWPLVQPILDVAQREALDAVAAASLPTLGSLTQIVVAAADGRVESLIVPRGVRRWGTFNPDSRVAVEHDRRGPGHRDLLDIAAVETLAHGGRVYVVPRADLPAHLPVAATVRY